MQERLATYVIPSNYRQIREEHKMVHPPWPWAGREVVPYTLPLHTTRYTPHPGFVKAGREVVNPKFYILSSKRNTPPETRTQTTKAPSRSRGGVAWRGVAWRGVAWRGVAWRGVASTLCVDVCVCVCVSVCRWTRMRMCECACALVCVRVMCGRPCVSGSLPLSPSVSIPVCLSLSSDIKCVLLSNEAMLPLNPQPSTLNPQPSTLNPQPSTLNPQPGVKGIHTASETHGRSGLGVSAAG
jgi:hypothetical protein